MTNYNLFKGYKTDMSKDWNTQLTYCFKKSVGQMDCQQQAQT